MQVIKGDEVYDICIANSEAECLELFKPYLAASTFGRPESKSYGVIKEATPEIFDPETGEIIQEAVEAEYGELTIAGDYTLRFVDVTQEIEQNNTNHEALSYLAETDWYVIRNIETGAEIPEEVLTNRAIARTKVVR